MTGDPPMFEPDRDELRERRERIAASAFAAAAVDCAIFRGEIPPFSAEDTERAEWRRRMATGR